jgi:hypothetical protein
MMEQLTEIVPIWGIVMTIELGIAYRIVTITRNSK